MNNYEFLEHYIIPSKLLNKLTKVYLKLGSMNVESLGKNEEKIFKEIALTKDAIAIGKLLHLDINDSRIKQLIESNITPKSQKEQVIKNIKPTLLLMNKDVQNFSLNPSEVIGYINNILCNKKIKYSEALFKEVENKKVNSYSVRFLINHSFDQFDEYITNEKYEKIILSSILFINFFNYQPLSDYNELGSLITLYYSLLRNQIEIVKYISFFERIVERFNDLRKLLLSTKVNFSNSFLDPTDVIYFILDIIDSELNEFNETIKKIRYKNKGLKSDNIILTILRLPDIFTKDDIRATNPDVSDATINRALISLRDNELIMPLGTGRSAKWKKINENIEKMDLSKLLG